jgi:hypothetical protein
VVSRSCSFKVMLLKVIRKRGDDELQTLGGVYYRSIRAEYGTGLTWTQSV